MDYFLIAKRLMATNGKEGIRMLLGNTRSTLERNIIDPMRDLFGSSCIGIVRQNNTVDMFGQKVYALGADKVTQVDKLRGSGIVYCYGDEITTWNKEVFQMLKSRLSLPDSVFDGTCNPDSPNHWFREFLSSKADIYQQNYQIYDNPFLPEEFIKSLEIEYEGTVYYDRYILGKWTKAEGLVYQGFSPDRDVISSINEELTDRRYVSIDYGTQNPTVFLLWQKGKSGTWYLIDEYYYSGRQETFQLTDSQYADRLIEFIKDRPVRAIIIDPSAASFKAELRHRGIKTRDAKNSVLNGIRFTATCLTQGQIKILDKCEHTIKEFGEYSWNDKKETDEPIKENDHCMDALRYFAYTILKRRKIKGGIRAL